MAATGSPAGAYVEDEDFISTIGESVPADAPRGEAIEHVNRAFEPIFGAVARDIVARGWSIFPQEMDGQRRPGTVDGEMIKWADEHDLANRLPSASAIDKWVAHCQGLNVAVVFGPASGHTFALDIDVTDPVLSRRCVELADEILGHTPFRRVGREPKIALLYRCDPSDPIRSQSRRFVATDEAGNPLQGEDGVEILASGKPLTLWGKHHKTGRYFRWLEATPTQAGPDTAPEVTGSMVKAWLEQVDMVRRFHRGAAFKVDAQEWTWDQDRKVHVPLLNVAAGGTPWVEGPDGKVVDGREAYLSHLVYRVVTYNYRIEAGDDPRFVGTLKASIYHTFKERAEMSGRWNDRTLQQEISGKVDHLIRKVRDGEIRLRSVPKDRFGEETSAFPMGWAPRDPDGLAPILTFLPDPPIDPGAPTRRYKFRCEVLPPREGEKAKRAIEADRSDMVVQVADDIGKALDLFFDDVYSDDLERRQSVHILVAPTGAGKTSRTIRAIAADSRTKQDYEYVDSEGVRRTGRCPIGFLLPTYANVEELRLRAQILNLDGSLSDDELGDQATALGLIREDELETRLADLRRDALDAGLVTMVYRGKLAAGCAYPEKVSLAMNAGLGTAAFCKVTQQGPDGPEDVHCDRYHDCPAITQRGQIRDAHVVFMPHSFLALTIPPELHGLRAIVADERIHHLFLHTETFSAASLQIARKKPRLTDKEFEQGLRAEEFLAERNSAASVALEAMRANRCPADALLRTENGLALVKSAIRVCGGALQRDGTLSPLMSIDEVRTICEQPTGVELFQEARFWRIIQERIEGLQRDALKDTVLTDLKGRVEAFPPNDERRIALEKQIGKLEAQARQTTGDRDYRIQRLLEQEPNGGQREIIRLSWRTKPNWQGKPLLLLDASAAPDVIRKIWGGVRVVEHRVAATMNVRVVGVVNQTFSNASVVGTASDPPDVRTRTALNLNRVRQAICAVSAMHGWGRVVAGSSIIIRRAVNTDWAGPSNVDWTHFGALRGLDFAKNHAAAISIGRMEVPIRTIDGLVAALSYDDMSPEQPFDRSGTGLDDKGGPLRLPQGVQRVRMRSGHDVELPVPMFPGHWGRMMQRQYREEELSQFLGRLRPVYREGEAPVWYALSSVLPDEIVVDDLIHVDDLLGKFGSLWEAARRANGVIHPQLSARVCMDLFSDTEEVVKAMRRSGLAPEDDRVEGRVAWGFVRLKVLFRGREEWAFVRADILDPAGAVREEFDRAFRVEPEWIDTPSLPRFTASGRARHPDKIDNEIGTGDQRKAEEEQNGVRVNQKVLDSRMIVLRDMASAVPRVFGATLGDIGVQVEEMQEEGSLPNQRFYATLTYADLEAKETLERLWSRLSGSPIATVEQPVIPDTGDFYDSMGLNPNDADEDD
jgi:hypothetical protein